MRLSIIEMMTQGNCQEPIGFPEAMPAREVSRLGSSTTTLPRDLSIIISTFRGRVILVPPFTLYPSLSGFHCVFFPSASNSLNAELFLLGRGL